MDEEYFSADLVSEGNHSTDQLGISIALRVADSPKLLLPPKSSASFLAVSGFRPSLPHRPQIQPFPPQSPSSPWRPIPRASPPSSRCTTTTRKRRTPTSPTPLPQRRPPPSPPPRRRPLKPGARTLALPWRLRRLPVPRSRSVSKP